MIKLADLGDALTITPALRALRSTFPEATIDALVTPVGARVLAGLDSIDHLLTFEKAFFDRLPRSPRPVIAALAFGRRLRHARYDRVFLLHHLFTRAGRVKYAALLAAAGAPWRAGLAEDQPRFLTHVQPDHGYGVRHEVDYWLDVVRLAGASTLHPRLEVAIPASARALAGQLLTRLARDHAGRWVALYPGSGAYSLARRWPIQRYLEVGRQLVQDPAIRLLVVGSDAERSLAQQLCQEIGPACYNLSGRTPDVKALAAILEQCDLLIGNDGGVMHLAAAVGTPIVAIFGPTNHLAWGPYGGSNDRPGGVSPAVVRVDLPCAPCMYRGFLPGARHGCQARDCLDQVPAALVLKAARTILDQLGRRPAE